MKTNPRSFKDLTAEQQDRIDAYLNGSISAEAFAALQQELMASPELRALLRRYLALDHHLQEMLVKVDTASESWLGSEDAPPVAAKPKPRLWVSGWMPVAAAAVLAFFLGLSSLFWGRGSGGNSGGLANNAAEPSAEGFAVVGSLFDSVWSEPGNAYREGDTLGAEVFRLAAGTAEIQFFSGATMTVQGPAEITLKSAWEATCQEGVVRMQVPPAARGFKLRSPSSEIVDLGTEFGLQVIDGQAHVEVFDGEIAIRHKDESERLVQEGAAWGLPSGGSSVPSELGKIAFPDVSQFGLRAVEQRQFDFNQWNRHQDVLAQDPRLIAYYTFEKDASTGLMPNRAQPRNAELDGAMVLSEPVAGRWPGLKPALEFHRPGSRVRVNIPGEFPAFTFMCWVRIDSLDRWYNGLFMGDGYETGEPHWQIRNDGQMMLSVMVDDSKPNPGAPNDAGFHRVYYSPPMWDISMSGEWVHLTSVFDPANRAVSHFVNGQCISSQEIEDRFFIDTLRIGNAEIGNWGQPFRQDPTFAIRNLNGRMDELALFKVALSGNEIEDLYEKSRAQRR